jgi:hypothetical protein
MVDHRTGSGERGTEEERNEIRTAMRKKQIDKKERTKLK